MIGSTQWNNSILLLRRYGALAIPCGYSFLISAALSEYQLNCLKREGARLVMLYLSVCFAFSLSNAKHNTWHRVR